MQGRHSAIHIEMDDHTRATLTGWLRKQKTPVGLAKRARAMLLLADGYSFAATARQVEFRERHVRKWALRFVARGLEGVPAVTEQKTTLLLSAALTASLRYKST